MAEIDDALPNQSVSDAEFKETEVTEVETPNEDIVQTSEDVEVEMDEMVEQKFLLIQLM